MEGLLEVALRREGSLEALVSRAKRGQKRIGIDTERHGEKDMHTHTHKHTHICTTRRFVT